MAVIQEQKDTRKSDKINAIKQSTFAKLRDLNENLEDDSERALVSPLKSVEKHKLLR